MYGLTLKIVIGMVAGIATGLLVNIVGLGGLTRVLLDGIVDLGGNIFVSSLKLMVVPMVFVSLVCGTGALDDIAKLGRIGVRTLIFYISTTALAITLALVVANLTNPGRGMQLATEISFEAQDVPPLFEVISNMFPSNPVDSMARGDMLQIIVFSVLFGIGINLAGATGKRVLNMFDSLNEVILKMVTILIGLAPYGVFCLLVKVFAEQGLDAIAPMAIYFFTVLACLIVHASVVYSSMIKLFANLNPWHFYRKFKDVIIFGFQPPVPSRSPLRRGW